MAKGKKKKRVFSIKKTFIFLIFIIILGDLVYYVINLPIKNIYVSGNNIVSYEDILSLAEINNYPSFILTTNTSIINKLKKNKYIESVKIQRKFFNKLYINIEEYEAVCINNDNKLILSNNLLVDNDYNVMDVPYIINEVPEDIRKNFIKKLSKIDTNILREISQIEYVPVEVDKSRFLLYMNDGNQVYITTTKINKLDKYNLIVEAMDGNSGIIYLDSGNYVEVKNKVEKVG